MFAFGGYALAAGMGMLVWRRRRPFEPVDLRPPPAPDDVRDTEETQTEKLAALGQLAGGVAHDFNNQIGTILVLCDVIRTQGNDLDPALLESIEVAATRAADLASSLLSFARKGRVVSGPVDVAEIVRETVNILRHSIDRKLAIELVVEAEPTVFGDKSQLQAALLNLGLNARDAVGSVGVIRFLVSTDDDGAAVIEVADDGCGMDDEVRKHIFEPFFSTKANGTGMGLAAVYGAVREHEGRVEVSSEEGRGARFRLTLPVTDARPETRALPSEPLTPAREGIVMLVDDEEIMRRAAGRLLEMLGFDVVRCADGLEAIDVFAELHDQIDLVVMDMVMPGCDGAETFRRMRKLRPRIPVIITSGYSEEGRVQDVVEQPHTRFLAKPFRRPDLLAAIRELREDLVPVSAQTS